MNALQLVAMAGLGWRHRTVRARLLPAFLAVATAMSVPRLLWPALAHDWNYWLLKEMLLILLAGAVVVEIAARIFAHLPRARRRLWTHLGLVVLGTLLAVWRAPGVAGGPAAGSWRALLVFDVLPRLAFGAAVLCLATLVVILRYGIPLDGLHRAVLTGLMLFLVVYAGPMASADAHSNGRFVMYHVAPLVYVAVVAMWAYMAWRGETDEEQHPPVSPEVLANVQAWRQDPPRRRGRGRVPRLPAAGPRAWLGTSRPAHLLPVAPLPRGV